MPRARLISPEFWTSEAVVDCPPMIRLLLLGLANFADDFGVQPLRPRTVRLQVLPGDALDDDQVRAMLDALVARGLLRRYAVDGVDYLAIVDWAIHQRVGRRARRRYPADPSIMLPSPREGGEKVPSVSEADEGLRASTPIADDRKASQCPSSALRAPSPSGPSAAPDLRGEKEDDAAWLNAVEAALRRAWGGDLPADVARYAVQWRAEGRDLARDVVPAIERAARVAADCRWPLRLQSVDAALPRIAAAFLPASAAPTAMGAPTP